MTDRPRLLLHQGICHTRAVALDADGHAARSYLTTEFDTALKLGEIVEAIIAKCAPHDGGCFLSVAGKREGFLSHRAAGKLQEGQHILCRVAAEARADKLARLVIASEADRSQFVADPLERWRTSLPTHLQGDFQTGPESTRRIDEVFDDALSPVCGLRNGGQLQITPTPALVAIDIDTIGRRHRGRASARARAVNIEAAAEAGQQIALRELGGNIVIDCIGPLAKPDGAAVKAAFVESFRAASRRKISCLPPSPLGMMEAIVEHGRRPLGERFFDRSGTETALGELLGALRRVEVEATARAADQLILQVPGRGFGLYLSHRKMIDEALQARFGGRIVIEQSPNARMEITDQ